MDRCTLRFHSGEPLRPVAAPGSRGADIQLRRWLPPRWRAVALASLAALLLLGVPAHAQQASDGSVPCPAEGQNLLKIPEFISKDGRLRATILLSDEQQRITFRQPYLLPGQTQPASAPYDKATTKCFPQYVRTFRGLGALPAPPAPVPNTYPDPLPGPTLRARLGDFVELTLINQINPAHFGNSIDRGETGRGGGCDESSSGYPGTDKYPDCFHGSSTGNLHFHGTHTNPNTTGDNVLIEIRPSLRGKDGKPLVTPESVRRSFDQFFARGEAAMKNSFLREWPKTWDDLPLAWTTEQRRLLQAYDTQMEKDYGGQVRKLWPIDARQLKQGAWPQYYIGAYPYFFRLPHYTEKTWPPAADHSQHQGAGTAEQDQTTRPLMMGQAPGTHWYHAHKHGSTAINVANGMTGAFIIEGEYDDELNNWYGAGWTRTQPVLVVNQIGVTPNLMRGSAGRIDKGPDFSVNGRLKPVIQMRPGEVQMWRIVNSSGRAGMYFSAPPTGFHWRQLAQDGVQFNDVNYQNSTDTALLMASGNRVDLLVMAPPTPCANPQGCDYPVLVQNEVDPSDLATANKVTLLTIRVSGEPVTPQSPQAQFIPKAPTPPPFLADIARTEVTGTKTIVFASTPPGRPFPGAAHTINGAKFDGEVGAVVLLNTVEEWKVVNETYGPQISHPFHIHINPFQVVEVFDPNATVTATSGPSQGKQVPKYVFDASGLTDPTVQCQLDPGKPDTWKDCHPPAGKNLVWWDVFPIPSGRQVQTANNQTVKVPGYFKMRSRFVDYAGYYVLHCHILAHEDRGMMTIVEVAPARTPYSHH